MDLKCDLLGAKRIGRFQVGTPAEALWTHNVSCILKRALPRVPMAGSTVKNEGLENHADGNRPVAYTEQIIHSSGDTMKAIALNPVNFQLKYPSQHTQHIPYIEDYLSGQ